MTEVTPAAPATPATPAATPATPVAPVVAATPVTPAVETSLIPDASAVTSAPVTPVTPAASVTPPIVNQNEPEWFLADGVKGEGKAPDWYKADKYKSVDEQAKAYSELEKRFGAFTGAPKDGAYEFKLPDGVTGEFDKEHPLFQGFQSWAKDNQLSQDGYNKVLGMFAEYEASMAPDMNVVKQTLGDSADARISAVASWAKTNLNTDEFNAIREATSGASAGVVFKALEAVIAKTKQVAMPKAGADVTAAQPNGEARIIAMQAKKNDKGQRLYEVDPAYRAEVERQRMEFYKQAA